MEKQPPPHLAILPIPGMGHLIPLVEFSKRLIAQHNFSITLIIPSLGDNPSYPQKTLLDSLPERINHIYLPPVSFEDLPEDVQIETMISLSVSRSLPHLRDILKSLIATTRLVACVIDIFCTHGLDLAKELNVSTYIFFPSTAMVLSLLFILPEIDASVSLACEFRDLPEPVKIPGFMPVHGKDLPDSVQDRKSDAYKWVLHHARKYRSVEGIIVNSFINLEPGAFKALQEGEPGTKPPVYPIGPLVNMGSIGVNGSECLTWLDDQPRGSVLFVSFGSMGTLSCEQINELALGLEMSEQRFLWVVRSPNKCDDQNDILNFLPDGFLERTRDKGQVVSNWAPQTQILSHGSTGGFMSQCGWNSSLESVVNGVPLIAWPLYSEQKMNAVMLTRDLKVALGLKASENGLIEREEIARVVKDLMEGEEGKKLSYRMRHFKEAAAAAISSNGLSPKTLAELVDKWTKN